MMYPRLAFDNIRKNSRLYFPYILTCIFTVAMFYMVRSLSTNEALGVTTAMVLNFGSYVIGVFAVIFLFYTHSFLIKNRKKEFGLYNILGMEKRHISVIIGFEGIYTAIISIVGGLGFGILFDRLMFAVIVRLIGVKITLGFHLSVAVVLTTIVLFIIVFSAIFINSLWTIHLSKPIELLNGGSVGEKEPRSKWIMANIGLFCMIAGYYIAVTTKNPVKAIELFFLAVVLVIIGTYLLFTAGSIVFLKLLRRNKNYYYKTRHFISVSGLIYRMKANAVGLANICILSTMVLVTVSSTTALILGVDRTIERIYPMQFLFAPALSEIPDENAGRAELDEIIRRIRKTADENGVTITDEATYSSLQFVGFVEGDEIDVHSVSTTNLTAAVGDDIDKASNICVLTAEDYSAYFGKDVKLADDEVILWQNKGKYEYDHFTLFGKEYKIIDKTDDYIKYLDLPVDICPTFGIVVGSRSVMFDIYQAETEVYGNASSAILPRYRFNTDLDEEEQLEFNGKIVRSFNNMNCGYMCTNRAGNRKEIYGLYGSMFFLGIFLGVIFTVATVLIIYYKQISEGYDDKKRFEIMQNVGMDESEVKGAIRSQVLTVFFLPLITAGIHTAFAFPLMTKVMTLFQLFDWKYLAYCTIGVYLAFAVIYVAVYLLTSRVYYKIVQK